MRHLGARPYPYILHRAHEAAVVTLQEKQQIEQMLAIEIRKSGGEVGEASGKQVSKDSSNAGRKEVLMTTSIQIGHLLRAGTSGFVAGCSVSQMETPAFGALVRAPIVDNYCVYGLIHDIHIDDDEAVQQLVTAGEVREKIIADSRINRIVPVEMSVLTVGYEQDGKISHLLPPRPPLSLDVIYLCSQAELAKNSPLRVTSATSAISCRLWTSPSVSCSAAHPGSQK